MFNVLTTTNKQTKPQRDTKKVLDGYIVCYLDCSNGFNGHRCMYVFKLIKLHILNIYSFFCMPIVS